MMMKIFFLFFMPLVVWSAPHQPFSSALSKGSSEYRFSYHSFTASKYNNNNITDVAFASGESFSEKDVDLGFLYGLADRMEIGLSGKFRMVDGVKDNLGTLESFSNSGLHSIRSDFKYGFGSSKTWEMAFIFGFGKTFFEVYDDNTTDKIALGDAGFFYDLGGALTYKLTSDNFLTSKLLFRQPGDDLSKEIFYQFEFGMLWPKLALFAGTQGIRTLGTDAYSDNIIGKPRIGVPVSNRYNSINRSIIEAYGGLRFNLTKKMEMGLKLKTTLAVNRSDYGQTLGVNFTYVNQSNQKDDTNKKFKSYRVEGEVIKVSPKRKYILIDKGLVDEVTRGMRFHIFVNDYTGGSKLIALGRAIKVQSEKSVLKIIKRYRRIRVKEGFVVRGGRIRR